MSFRFSEHTQLSKIFLSSVVALGVFLVGVVSVAQADTAGTVPTDTGFSVQLFQPAPGPVNFFSVESAELGDDMTPSFGLLMTYQHRPFVLLDCTDDGECTDSDNTINAVNNLMSFDLLASFNFLKFLQVGLAFPMSYMKGTGFTINDYSNDGDHGAVAGDDYSSFVINDIRIHLKARVLGKEGKDGPSLAIALIPSIPLAGLTGMGQSSDTEDNGAYGYGGDGFMTLVAPKLIFGYRFGPVRSSINLGALWRQKSEMLSAEIGHSIVYGGAVGYSIIPAIEIVAELYGSKSLTSANFSDSEGAPLLFLGGGRARAGDFVFSLAGGGGIISGIGVPQFQILGGMAWSPKSDEPPIEEFVINELDLDGDGIENDDDACPEHPEDTDGFQDEDGCPDDDNDNDGIVDGYDSCPMEAEDADNFRDDDGCPDLDHDEDGINEGQDKCPDQAEDFDDFEDADGCPEADNDKDGFEDGVDFCINQPEDKDGFEDQDGCPDLDNDADGVPDTTDKCPNEAETLNGFKDDDGCPDRGKALVIVTEERIDLKETILFKTGAAKIKGAKSFEILDIVSDILRGNTAIRISIEGHTDNRGDADKNRELSKERAEAVKAYFVDKGVDKSRLETVGWGPDQPIEENKTRAGRKANRRVEFMIIRPQRQVIPPQGETVDEGAGDGEMDFTAEEEATDEMDFTAE